MQSVLGESRLPGEREPECPAGNWQANSRAWMGVGGGTDGNRASVRFQARLDPFSVLLSKVIRGVGGNEPSWPEEAGTGELLRD